MTTVCRSFAQAYQVAQHVFKSDEIEDKTYHKVRLARAPSNFEVAIMPHVSRPRIRPIP